MKTALALMAILAAGQDGDPLQAQIDALKVAKAPWRDIPWKTCLLEGLRESAEKQKPVILWVFIDRPVDDKRC